jgi:hypothetical protein
MATTHIDGDTFTMKLIADGTHALWGKGSFKLDSAAIVGGFAYALAAAFDGNKSESRPSRFTNKRIAASAISMGARGRFCLKLPANADAFVVAA